MIVQVVIPTPLRRTFDYLIDDDAVIAIGMRVWVPFGKRRIVGLVYGLSQQSDYDPKKLKKIESVIDNTPLLDESLLTLYGWASDYYHYPIGEVVLGTLPKRLRQGAVLEKIDATNATSSEIPLVLTEAQSHAVTQINKTAGFQPFLLAGVTGSGKTEVYLQAIAAVLEKNQQALVLVPEISLTPQTFTRFQKRFSVPVLLLHSGLTDKQRALAWMQSKQDTPCIVIGTRSAIFAPLPHCGIIIVDEEHDASFKQQSMFRYAARDVAIMRAKQLNIPIVLGSATPALETWKNAQEQKYTLLSLDKRVGNARLPSIILHNCCAKKMSQGLSDALVEKIKMHLAQNQQVLLFLNRRGYAPLLLCHLCGHIEKCKRCDTKMVLHEGINCLRCHHCHYTKAIPKTCQQCQQTEMLALGLGTEQLESQLSALFPQKKVVRIDRDTAPTFKKLGHLLAKIHDNQADIIVGTQMIIKGHHFENVTLVGVVDTDHALFSSDFRAIERLGQSLIQVSGRAGRAEKSGEVFIQTHHPDHALLQAVLRDTYAAFANALLAERSSAKLPPYTHFAVLRAESKSKAQAQRFLETVKAACRPCDLSKIAGPFPLLIEKMGGRYRAQLLMQGSQRAALKRLIVDAIAAIEKPKITAGIKWVLDIDPLEIA